MSALLERMVQRTRGPLSTVEPVAPPPFGAGGAPASAGLAGEPEGFAEVTEASSEAVQTRASNRQAPRGRGKRHRGVHAEARRPLTLSHESDSERNPPSSGRPDPDPAPADAPPDATRAEVQRATPGEQSARTETKPAAEPIVVVARPAETEPEPFGAAPPRPAAEARTGDDEVPAPAPPVTISIGHIEVRAAPTPSAAPAPSPFRPPQVSLSDFLQQKERRG